MMREQVFAQALLMTGELEEKKRELENEEQTLALIRDITGKEFTVTNVKKAEKKRSAAPPFTTSTLQQEASRKLGMTPKRTMAIAQQLYDILRIC